MSVGLVVLQEEGVGSGMVKHRFLSRGTETILTLKLLEARVCVGVTKHGFCICFVVHSYCKGKTKCPRPCNIADKYLK